MVLASGHAALKETLALFRSAAEAGIGRMVVTHPPMDADREMLRRILDTGAFAEYPFLSCAPSRRRAAPAEIVDVIRGLGVSRCVVTTDFGQWMNPPPAEGMRMAIAELLHAGMEPDEVSTLVKRNPLELVGLGDEFAAVAVAVTLTPAFSRRGRGGFLAGGFQHRRG